MTSVSQKNLTTKAPPPTTTKMDLLEDRLGHKFKSRDLLTEALTHSADYSNVLNSSKHTCDRLKIIGDCVIKLLTCQYAISVSNVDARVGTITKIKDDLCNRVRQNQIGSLLEVGSYVALNHELLNQPSFSIGNHLDIYVKSLIGAVFIDAGGSHKKGFVITWKCFLKLWKPYLGNYDPAKPLIACFPQPALSSRDFLLQKFKDLKLRDLKELEGRIGFVFSKKPYLLEQALTHDQISDFSKTEFSHYQCLEFLGDSVLELIITEYLYSKYTSSDPLGQMLFFNRETGQKLYSSKFQVKVAKKLQIDQFVIKQPCVSMGSYDDFVESIIGAIYVHSGISGLKKTAQIVLDLWGLQPLDIGAVPDAPLQQQPPSAPEEDPLEKELQSKLNYKFKDKRILKVVMDKEESDLAFTPLFTNLEILGKRVIQMLLAEYVVGICPATNANLSAKVKKSVENLHELLSSSSIMNDIATKFDLKKFIFTTVSKEKAYDSYICAIFGAVYVDSLGKYGPVSNIFNTLWNSYVKAKPKKYITECFPSTSEEQKKFRVGVNRKITDEMLKRLNKKLSYTFVNVNLFEQAFTDEKSQGCAKAVYNACPTGNPFGLRLIGKSVTNLYAAYRSYINTASCSRIFEQVMERIDQNLYKVITNNFADLDKYYAKLGKFSFPPSTKPRAPYEALLGAIYVDAGGGNSGFDNVVKVLLKHNPGLAFICKAKAGPENSLPCTTPDASVANNSSLAIPSTPADQSPANNKSAIIMSPAPGKNATLLSNSPGKSNALPNDIFNPGKNAAATPQAKKSTPPPQPTLLISTPSKSIATPGSREQMTPINSKCAANFSISPDQIQKTPPRPAKKGSTPSSPAPPEMKLETKTYASVLAKPVPPPNLLVAAALAEESKKAPSKIQASKPLQETPKPSGEQSESKERKRGKKKKGNSKLVCYNSSSSLHSQSTDVSRVSNSSTSEVTHKKAEEMDLQEGSMKTEDKDTTSQTSIPDDSRVATGSATVPINMVFGYPHEKFRQRDTTTNDRDPFQKKPVEPEDGASSGGSGGTTVFRVMKWTAVVLGVMFFINRYSRGGK